MAGQNSSISKVLVANRGEIAIRAFRAAYEMGIDTVAVYPYEDRNSLHRLKADESYQIGETGHPVRAYLSVSEIMRVALEAGCDAVYPGYGFLSENPELAAACAQAGITFVGPSAAVLELTGNKARAIAAARDAGLPVLASSEPSASVDDLVAAAEGMEFPLFVKAVSGGGGRGMRRVADRAALPEAVEAASREAESAFGDPMVYLEQAVLNPRHIEVQILADADGNVMHLFERDCSVQRRHQKVIELAPAPNLPAELREKICGDAVAFAREIGMPLTAYRPLAHARVNKDETLQGIAAAHGVTPAAVTLAFLMAEGHIVIPASSNAGRLAENFAARDVTLSTADIEAIRALDSGTRLIDPEKAPAWDD